MAGFIYALAAAAQTEAAELQPQLQPSMAGLFFRLVISLLMILLLTLAVFRIIRKHQKLQLKLQREKTGWIRIYDFQALAPNKGLYLVEVFSRVYVLAAGESGLSVLLEIDQDDEEWQAVKAALEASEQLIPPGITAVFKDRIFGRSEKRPRETFEKELSQKLSDEVNKRLEKTHRLFHRAKEGENGSE
ncbi:MAG: flagellar biosynthetic protein FliO [Peptococcaceae bacterium]|jgi:flagellar biogenesis protein FliO|nr:flagellar biosynthetic protein FliO [Peptococcaceae bacterium]MDH7524049.1 flagellar biosynthetic protein FliO [Peptococcaceae bacterium]